MMADASVQNYLITAIIIQVLNEPRMYKKGFQPFEGWKPCETDGALIGKISELYLRKV
jgi:hypothetical protein